jgi:4-hydroxy-3-methylbut-2-enyl diphosphate reductase
LTFLITDSIIQSGISAGASTPDWIIESVIKKVKELTNTIEKEVIHESRVRF